MEVLSVSARFVQPFAQVLSTYESFGAESLNKLRAIDPACRIPATVANELAVRQVAVTGDPDLGFKAARAMPLGRAGALDYAMYSAATVRESTVVADRYIRAYSDVLSVRLEREDSRAVLKFEMSVPVPKTILDFTISAWYANHMRAPLAGRAWTRVLVHASETVEHDRIRTCVRRGRAAVRSPGQRLRVSSENTSTRLACAPRPLPPRAALRARAAVALQPIDPEPDVERESPRDRFERLAGGRPDRLHGGSPASHERPNARAPTRTRGNDLQRAARHLEAGARPAVRHPSRARVHGIAFRLGFSHVEAFYRAFKRWTGQTPLTYRRAKLADTAA